MTGSKIHDEPSSIDAEAGVVIVDGPGGVALSLTPDAAHETGDKLKAGASKARGQREGRIPPCD